MASEYVACVCVQAAEVEKQLSTQVHSLRDDFREKSLSTSQHMTRLEALQAEVSPAFTFPLLYAQFRAESCCGFGEPSR